MSVLVQPVVPATKLAAGLSSWPVPVAEFALVKAVAGPVPLRLPGAGPRIVLCLAGVAVLAAGAQRQLVPRGQAVFVAATEPSVALLPAAGGEPAVVFQASPG